MRSSLLALLLIVSPLHASMEFDGTNDTLSVGTIGNYDLERDQPFTMSAWVLCTNNTQSSMPIFTKGDGTGATIAVAVRPGAPLFDIYLQSAGGGSDRIFKRFGTLNTSVLLWNHYLVTYDGSSDVSGVKLYINGFEKTTVTYSENSLASSIVTSEPMVIGYGYQAPYEYGAGQIDDARIYNRVLSLSEIQSLAFSRSRPKLTDGYVGYWPLDEGPDNVQANGACAIDRSGNGNTGTAGSGAKYRASVISYP